MTAVCLRCGAVYFVASGHACAVAAYLPDGTPHPDPFLAERGWVVVRGLWMRPDSGGDGEEQVA
jgi:hypothetical protein